MAAQDPDIPFPLIYAIKGDDSNKAGRAMILCLTQGGQPSC